MKMTDHDLPSRSATDRYRLQGEVASGGMATVYLADDVVLGRPVALKILTRTLAADDAFVDRFRREAQAAARFRHPNIVTVYDWGPYEDSFFIAMEYIEGRTLDQVIASDGPLAPSEAARIAGEIAGALEVAHREGVVHRDIKPSNIIITPTGQIKIADFGIARASNAGADLTQVGMIMGTAAYLSPEQAQGATVDRRSDLYSLGVVLFEMVTGAPPFSGDSTHAVATHHVSSPPPRLRSRQPSLPTELDELVDRLLAKNPDHRYQSATALVPELRKIQAGESAGSLPTARDEKDDHHGGNDEATTVMASSPGSSPALLSETDAASRAVPATEIMPESLRPDRRSDPPPPVPEPEPSRSTAGPRSGSTPSGFLVGGAAAVVVVVAAALVLLASGIGPGGSEGDNGATTTAPSADQETSTTQTTDVETSTVDVPNLVGRSPSEAEQVLGELGLPVSVEEVEVDDPSQAGQVVAQDPQAGQAVETGSTVVIRVGRAASTTTTAPNPTTTTTETTVAPTTGSTTVDSSTTASSSD
jgi:serine/threonine-protein kinase